MNFPISNLCENFDIDNPPTGIVSLWGDFGVGKTTFVLQTALNATLYGKVIYIYSKPDLPYEKIENILSENSSAIMENLLTLQVLDFYSLNDVISKLEILIITNLKEKESHINFIIIDSLTDLYRLELNKEKKEKNFNLNYQLNQILATLYHLNEIYKIEVLIVNEMSRKNYIEQIKEVQSGGKVMDYWIKYSVKIERTVELNVRKLILAKHPKNRNNELFSKLTKQGFK